MVLINEIRVLRELSKDRQNILDGGCGNGTYAIYLSRNNPKSFVYGYDISTSAVEKATRIKEKHNVPNVKFFIASHDDFEPPHKMDLVYTLDSLVGRDERAAMEKAVIDNFNLGANNPVMSVEEIVKKRFGKFREMLNPNGIYLLSFQATLEEKDELEKQARSCGLELNDFKKGVWRGYHQDGMLTEDIFRLIMAFTRA